ncbi:MAG: membrane protein FxsA [Calditrichia bacterium]
MFLKLFLLFTLIPVAELYVLIKVGGMIGAFNTILIIFFTAIVGAYLAKSEGMLVLSRIQEAIRRGQAPGRELLHGVFVLAGGLLLLTPGLITDFLGISMLLPPSREIYIRRAERIIRDRIETGQWHISFF